MGYTCVEKAISNMSYKLIYEHIRQRKEFVSKSMIDVIVFDEILRESVMDIHGYIKMMRDSEYRTDYFLVVSNVTLRKWTLKKRNKVKRGKPCYSELDLAIFPFPFFYLTTLVPFVAYFLLLLSFE